MNYHDHELSWLIMTRLSFESIKLITPFSNNFHAQNLFFPLLGGIQWFWRAYGYLANIFIFYTGYFSPNLGRVQPRWGSFPGKINTTSDTLCINVSYPLASRGTCNVNIFESHLPIGNRLWWIRCGMIFLHDREYSCLFSVQMNIKIKFRCI